MITDLKIVIMKQIIKPKLIIAGFSLIMAVAGCRKSAFDINSVNPNTPSSVDPKYVLSASLASSASMVLGGNEDFINYWMGYWAVYGITSSSILTYNITNDYFSDNWDKTYTTLENYHFIEQSSIDPANAYFRAMAKIMKAYHFQRLVDTYNNVPYTEALSAGNFFPKFDDAGSIYKDLVVQLDSAVIIIGQANVATVNNPGQYDILFKGQMNHWVHFAHTLKLKLLMHQTQLADGPAYITSHLTGLSSADFLGGGEDAAVNPGYSNSSQAQQNPQWQDVGFATNGSPSGFNQAYRANSYAVQFYNSTNDPRDSFFYALNDAGLIRGRAFGSSDENQSNTVISGVGPGILKSPGMDAVLLPAFESLFIQAEAVQRGYLTGNAGDLFKSGLTESFRLLGVPDYVNAARAYYQQASGKVNIDVSSNPIHTIILQKWAALNGYDALEAWSDWRRLGIPEDLPISIYPGTTAKHIPYRLLYPTSEYSYNATNIKTQGTINQFSSKIFWMP